MSGLDDFKKTLREFRGLALWATAGTGLLPILGHFAEVAPVWPSNSALLTSICILIVLALCFQTLRSAPKKRVTRVMFVSSGIMFWMLGTYLVLSLQFVVSVGRPSQRIVLGCGWNELTRDVATEFGARPSVSCPGNYRRLLAAAEYDSTAIYEIWPLTAIKFITFTSWLMFFCGFSIAVGAFVIHQMRVR